MAALADAPYVLAFGRHAAALAAEVTRHRDLAIAPVVITGFGRLVHAIASLAARKELMRACAGLRLFFVTVRRMILRIPCRPAVCFHKKAAEAAYVLQVVCGDAHEIAGRAAAKISEPCTRRFGSRQVVLTHDAQEFPLRCLHLAVLPDLAVSTPHGMQKIDVRQAGERICHAREAITRGEQ